MRTAIHDGIVLLPEQALPGGWVLIEEGRIEAVGQGRPPAANEHVNAQGCYISPGFIDMHVHGGGGHDFMDASVAAMRQAAKVHLEHGTTGIVPTTLTGPDEELMEVFACYHSVKNDRKQGPRWLGLHLEGPYFAKSQAGAQDPEWIRSPDPAHYRPILEAGGRDIAIWSAAVELDGALAFGDELAKRGILASIGHSDADSHQVREGLAHGFSHVTHLYSAMSTIRRRGAYRHLGVVESAYLYDALSVEIIADGCHLPPELIRLITRHIPAHRIALVTDAIRGAGLPEGSETILGNKKRGKPAVIRDQVAFLPDFSAFAGSVCTADRCIRTMKDSTGWPLEKVVPFMSHHPAVMLGLGDRLGLIRPGYEADLCLLDENLKVRSVWVAGQLRHLA